MQHLKISIVSGVKYFEIKEYCSTEANIFSQQQTIKLKYSQVEIQTQFKKNILLYCCKFEKKLAKKKNRRQDFVSISQTTYPNMIPQTSKK